MRSVLALALLAAAPFALLALAAPARAQGTLPDFRITLRQESTDTPGGFATEILYIKGDRQRRDVFVKAPEDAAPRHVEKRERWSPSPPWTHARPST